MPIGVMAGSTQPGMRKALPVGRATRQNEPWACLAWFHPMNWISACRNPRHGATGWVRHGRQDAVPWGACCPAPRFRYFYPPEGCCKISVSGHRHVRGKQYDIAYPLLLRHLAGPSLRRAVTARITNAVCSLCRQHFMPCPRQAPENPPADAADPSLMWPAPWRGRSATANACAWAVP